MLFLGLSPVTPYGAASRQALDIVPMALDTNTLYDAFVRADEIAVSIIAPHAAPPPPPLPLIRPLPLIDRL